MNETEIIEYTRSNLKRGLTLIEIKQTMLSMGVSDYDIEKALRDSKIGIEEKNKEEREIIKEKKDEDNSIEGWDNS